MRQLAHLVEHRPHTAEAKGLSPFRRISRASEILKPFFVPRSSVLSPDTHDVLQKISSPCLRNAAPDWHHVGKDKNDDPALIAWDWGSIRNIMGNDVGISLRWYGQKG